MVHNTNLCTLNTRCTGKGIPRNRYTFSKSFFKKRLPSCLILFVKKLTPYWFSQNIYIIFKKTNNLFLFLNQKNSELDDKY